MTKEELLAKLKELKSNSDCEDAHIEADDALLDYINDQEISESYGAIGKWYA